MSTTTKNAFTEATQAAMQKIQALRADIVRHIEAGDVAELEKALKIWNDPRTYRFAVEAGYTSNLAIDPYELAVKHGHASLIGTIKNCFDSKNPLLKNPNDCELYLAAVAGGRINIIRALHQNGIAAPNYASIVNAAVQGGNFQVFPALVNAGLVFRHVYPARPRDVFYNTDSRGLYLMEHGTPEMLEYALRCGASFNGADVSHAASLGRIEMLKKLPAHIWDRELQDRVVDIATDEDNSDLIRFIHKNGANLSGKTASAIKKGRQELATLMKTLLAQDALAALEPPAPASP